ncbi:MAG TPA: hypothetical protein DIT07_15270 [Sphingobacteriaceae bacterium]|nr:hypothetical protein [Sphingobacteriaceae bacterium]
MASLNTKKTIASLTQKGFVLNNTHHQYYEFWHDGKLIAQTYTSHSGDTLNDYLIGSMKKQCKMEKNFFIDFAKCTKTKDDYLKVLKQNGFI